MAFAKFQVLLPSEPTLRPTVQVARRLLERLKGQHVSPEVIEIAEKTLEAAIKAEDEDSSTDLKPKVMGPPVPIIGETTCPWRLV